MGQPAAKQGDRVVGTDVHVVLVPAPPKDPVPTPLTHPFAGPLTGGLSSDVLIAGKPAATVGSTADNAPAHVPAAPGTAFQRPPANRATVLRGSASVLINGKPAARAGDPAMTCNDPADLPAGTVVASGSVVIG
ncbi:MAG: PAAR domain-containing protein [Pseudonocardia sp.]